jgi:hypothetical protein
LFDLQVVVYASVLASVFVLVNEVKMVSIFALSASVNVTTALRALLIALLAVLLPIITVGVVDLSFFFALLSASVRNFIELHVIFANSASLRRAKTL